ncbi:uncharacterized protein PAC_12877 [Phialocephala subalpina]|uniref:Ankyrin n=1 Tax=Phialocephala subalpina TaxID=576137 RepID=A0A1L7XD57_9HELO|nr:uncharacterized protein PAC_12877 [Phialocephala subalpina]
MDEPEELSFQLPPEYIEAFPHRISREPRGISALMKAAANKDSRILRAVLACRSNSRPAPDRKTTPAEYQSWLREQQSDTFGPNAAVETPGQDPINSPLLQAIRSQLPGNADLLLKAGADPDGIDMETQEMYQALFLRFRPSIPDYVDIDGDVASRQQLLGCMKLPQTAPITREEIEQRALTVSPFWTFANAMMLGRYPKGDEMHSLVAAAMHPSTEMIDKLLETGADASSWIYSQIGISEDPMPSNIAISSPLHAAVATENVGMISHLLSRGFDPNFLPTGTPLMALTPLMSTFLSSEQATTSATSTQTSATSQLPLTFNQALYDTLISHPSIRYTTTSYVLRVHVFHLAAAHVSFPLFKYILSTIPLSPSYVLPTALDHTLLHIACLPPSTRHFKRSLTTLRSIHDTRCLQMPQSRRIIPSHATGSFPHYDLNGNTDEKCWGTR